MAKLTKRAVDELTSAGKPTHLWDDGLAGFGVKALPSGAKKYVVKYRASGGGRSAAQRWILLGAHGQLTCDQARQMAQQVLAAVARGEDPQAEKFSRRAAPTFDDVWARFVAEHLGQLKPPTRRDYEAQWRDVVQPKFGATPVASISRSDIESFHKGFKRTPYRANRILALCSRLMTLTEAWEWRPPGSNPCRHVQRFKEQSRSRYLSSNELEKLGVAVKEMVAAGEIQDSAANAIKLLLLTGARLNEILMAKWAWIDWERCALSLPDSKTGPKLVYLSDAALLLLKSQQKNAAEMGSEFVFPGRSVGKRMINLRKPWTRVCQRIDLHDVRLHDLRHTAASVAVGQGISLPVIGRLLGHSQAQTTLRYAHVDSDPALVAANQIGRAIGSKLI